MYNIITLGSDCSPAAVLRNLNLRNIALPFDWVVSNINSLEKCFSTNFKNFHKNLRLNENNKRLIDEYGFEYPHDYPLVYNNEIQHIELDKIGEGLIGEENNKYICNNWNDYHLHVLEKYNRRIERFQNMLYDTKPIIALSRYSPNDIIKLKDFFITYYNKHNIIFINSSNQDSISDNIININTEINNTWNDMTIWKKWIDFAIFKLIDNNN